MCMCALRIFSLALVGVLGLSACQWDVGSLEIRCVYSAVEGERPFDPDRV